MKKNGGKERREGKKGRKNIKWEEEGKKKGKRKEKERKKKNIKERKEGKEKKERKEEKRKKNNLYYYLLFIETVFFSFSPRELN
tara:strand:+ start:137 stop:388 length:252 start_codon:yes stop_codon:yes gene_type:complete